MLNNIFKLTAILFALLFSGDAVCAGLDSAATDTVRKPRKPATLILNAQFHTTSMYYFTGVVSDQNPNFDIKFVYDNNGWGALIYKSFELIKDNPPINYSLIVLNKKFFIGPAIMISPQVGVQLNQIGNIAGPGSDFLTNLTIAFRFARNLTISNDAVMQNLILTNRANWTNRVKLNYLNQNFNASVSVWERNRIFGNPGYLSAGMDIGYNGIKLSPHMSLFVGASSISVFRADTPRKSGFMLNFGVGI